VSSDTLARWLKALVLFELARIRVREQRKRTCEPMSKDMGNKAVQAFRAMHVETVNWNGLTA
jgi:hypothetical protein